MRIYYLYSFVVSSAGQTANIYYRQHIREDLFKNQNYDSSVIPIGSLDYEKVTNSSYSSIDDFIYEKCDAYVEHMIGKLKVINQLKLD